MLIKELMSLMTEAERHDFARRAGTTVNYLWLLSGGQRRPSPKLAKKLVDADRRLTLEKLRPDIWGQRAA